MTNKTDKKLECKRLLIFLFLAFALSWIPAILFNKILGYHDWFETNRYPVTFWFMGYGPALANVITRKITNEGWHDSMLHLRLKGHIKYYVIAVLIESVIVLPVGIMTTLVYGGGDFSQAGENSTATELVSDLLLTLTVAPLSAFYTFGEEFGWRGYMNQKMEPLFGTTGTVILGGILWGVWHAELTVEGYNFGTGYPGYPWLGILAMCIMCTFTGIVLMWLTKKTGSIYPAAIMHAMHNFGGRFTSELFVSGVPQDFSPTIAQDMVCRIPEFALCTVFLVLMLIDNRKKKVRMES